MLGEYCTTILENSLGVREVEPQTPQRGASATGHTPLRTLDSTPTHGYATDGQRASRLLLSSSNSDSMIVQPRVNCQYYLINLI
jgi:hypothetical protein